MRKEWIQAVLAMLTMHAHSCLAAWQTFDTSDGLASNTVLCITVDSTGAYWFGTDAGVSRFDGAKWQNYTPMDGLAHREITAIVEDRSGHLWFGTRDGVSRYDGAGWRTYRIADGLVNNDVWSILEDHAGNLWFGTSGGASRFDGTNWRNYTSADGLPSPVAAIAEDRSGILWFGTGAGLSRFDGTSWRTFTTLDGLPDYVVPAVLEDRAGNLWVGTRSGLCRWDGSSWHTISNVDGYVARILEDRSGKLWFANWGYGVACYDGDRWRFYNTAEGLADYDVYSLLEDDVGNMWFGTGRGVTRYDRSGWRTLTQVDGLPNDGVLALLEDHAGDLWFATNSGVARWDGRTWRTYTTVDGLASDFVLNIFEDSSRRLWFGTWNAGLSCFDGSAWQTYARETLWDVHVTGIAEDLSGNLWVGTSEAGVSRFDGSRWRRFTSADGLPSDYVTTVVADRAGSIWIGTYGASRYDGTSWRTFTTADGLGFNVVEAIAEDHAGNLWFGTSGGGVSRFDGSAWRTFSTADGLADDYVNAILQDHSRNLWVGSGGGLTRYDGSEWRTYHVPDGLAHDAVSAILEDHMGRLWFGTAGGATVHEVDLVAPKTGLLVRPPALVADRRVDVAFAAAFGEAGIEFSTAFDEEPWSPWSLANTFQRTDLLDGMHRLQVRGRDREHNIEPKPAACTFRVDATPPAAVIESPTFGQVVRKRVDVRGRASDARFLEYHLDFRPATRNEWDSTSAANLVRAHVPVVSGTLAEWDTATLDDGRYELRLAVHDSLGLSGTTVVEVIVDNHLPWAGETAPVRITAATGGDVYTTNGELHLYFPPHAFPEDVLVTIAPNPADSVPESLPSGALRVLPGYDVSWSGATLVKQATLEFSYAGVDIASFGSSPALYGFSDRAGWHQLGGTMEPGTSRISLVVTNPGRYALFFDQGAGSGASGLSSLSLTPRVFSPMGGFADRQVGIGFSLGRFGPVTVRIYSRSGRLIRDVVVSQSMNAGANLVRWDGRNSAGRIVDPGLYVVSVEAQGQTRTHTVAVSP